MYIFSKFLIVFLYLEISMVLFAFFLEIYRLIFYNHAVKRMQNKRFRRRILKEITTICKGNNNEFFDLTFFFICLITIGKYFI